MQSTGGEGSSSALFIDTYQFWITAIVAILALRLVTEPRTRQYVLAVANLVFLTSLLGRQVVWIIGTVGLLYALLGSYKRVSLRLSLTVMIIFASSAMFLTYKSGFFRTNGEASLQAVLTAIGFSFVFLRLIDLARVLQDGRHDPPGAPDLLNFLLPFHMLAAGPIQAYDDFARQPAVPRALSVAESLDSTQRVAGGLFKKFVLAYLVQKTFLTDLQAGGIWFFIEVQMLLLWLYLDFSAYSDIAVGLGRLMGVATPENFDRPWLSRNLIEFWDRWHISLSQWIRRNLFIPVQLNLMRRYPRTDPVLIAALAIGVSFSMAGIWHGLSPGWLLWGGMHALGLMTVRLYTGWLQKRRSPEQLTAYRANRLILFAARILTIEYAAAAFAAVFLVK